MITRTGFDALDVSLDLIRSLRTPLSSIRTHDCELFRQLRKAAASVPLNVREGRRRTGKDRPHLWRVAAGSADEVIACLLVAEAWGYVARPEIGESLELADRILAMLHRLTQ